MHVKSLEPKEWIHPYEEELMKVQGGKSELKMEKVKDTDWRLEEDEAEMIWKIQEGICRTMENNQSSQ